MKNLFIAISALFLLSSCDPFRGTFDVQYAFLVKGKSDVVVPKGTHAAKIEQQSDKKILVVLNEGKQKVKFTLESKNKLDIPANGAFNVTAAELSQDFSVKGDNQTVVTDSELRWGSESCSYQRPERVCYPSGNTVVCRDEWVTRYGYRDVEYFDRTTDQNILAQFVHTNGGKLGDFDGQRSSVERFYRYQGQCR